MSVTHGRTPKLVSGVYRIINEASQSTVRVHQHAQPLLLSYRYELLGVFEQWELTVQDKGSYELRCMGLTLGQVGIENGVCIINGGNPVNFEIDSIGDGLYTVKAGEGQYWGIEQSPTRQKPEVSVKLASAPSTDGEFESTQLWRFERLDDDASHH